MLQYVNIRTLVTCEYPVTVGFWSHLMHYLLLHLLCLPRKKKPKEVIHNDSCIIKIKNTQRPINQIFHIPPTLISRDFHSNRTYTKTNLGERFYLPQNYSLESCVNI